MNDFLWNRKNTTHNTKNDENLDSLRSSVRSRRAATTLTNNTQLTIDNNEILAPETSLKLADKLVATSKKRWIPRKTKSPTPSVNSHLEKSQISIFSI